MDCWYKVHTTLVEQVSLTNTMADENFVSAVEQGDVWGVSYFLDSRGGLDTLLGGRHENCWKCRNHAFGILEQDLVFSVKLQL